MISRYLFVYGTLKRSSRSPFALFLGEQATFIDNGFFFGKLFQIGHYPGAVPSELPEDKVFGEIYRLFNPARTLPALDHYEEFGPSFPEPNEFRRELQTVYPANGSPLQAWVYLYNRNTSHLNRIEAF